MGWSKLIPFLDSDLLAGLGRAISHPCLYFSSASLPYLCSHSFLREKQEQGMIWAGISATSAMAVTVAVAAPSGFPPPCRC